MIIIHYSLSLTIVLSEQIDLQNNLHQEAIFTLMDAYMQDKMGCEEPLDRLHFKNILNGLKQQCNYLGVLIKKDDEYIGLANCFINFSTFKAKQLLNIHDFIVLKEKRGIGAGKFLMQTIKNIANNQKYSKVTLEVRYDNEIAQNLYKSEGFEECHPPMYFWQHNL